MKRGRLSYIFYFLSNVPKVMGYKLFRIDPRRKTFRGVPVSIEKTSDTLKELLLSDKPFCAVRFGCVELSALNNREKIRFGWKKDYKPSVKYSIRNNAGYFPADDVSIGKYADTLLALLPEVDYLGVHGGHMENYFAKYYCTGASYLLYEGMEPLRGEWRFALKGKKVLIITSFPNDIEEQFRKKDKLFRVEEALPDFELITLQAPVTFADATPNDTTFFDELEALENKMDALDYDVLLVGAGAYGTFLAIHAKEQGKQAIQTGGATPTLFGIIGKRWEKREHVAKHVNEYWIHPSEKPLGFEKIEQGAYW